MWIVSTALILLGGGAWEWHGRWLGCRPSVIDDRDLWCHIRQTISGGGSHILALVGTSRSQCDLDTTELRKQLPDYTVAQLSIDGTSPVPILQSLAEDESFHGVVIYDVLSSQLGNELYQETPRDYLHHYRRNWHFGQNWDRALRSFWQQIAVIANPQWGLLPVFRNIEGEPHPSVRNHVTTHPDRSREVDFYRADPIVFQRIWVPPKIASLETAATVDKLLQAAQSITARGGTVVFVQFPTSGITRTLEEQTYPRSEYWDRFAQRCTSLTLNVADVPELARFQCPDGSHLDARDRLEFTQEMLRWLQGREVVKSP